ncbi:MAG: hypothetical protein IJH39_11155 [Clostridia bacterium]|nr:hypothetical protein [Clostridia bacterium]
MIYLGIKHNIKNFVYEEDDLKKLSTRELIGFICHIRNWHFRNFNADYRYDGDYESRWEEYIKDYVVVKETWPDNYHPTEYYWTDEKVLRDILKTRPNIPNKIQRKNALKKIIAQNKKKVKRNIKYNKYD